MGWVIPDSTSDPNNGYTNDANAIDNNTSTYAYTSSTWYYLYCLLNTAISCDKVRIYGMISDGSNPDVSIQVKYGGSYHTIFSGTITANTWVEKSIGSTETVSEVAVKPNSIPFFKKFYLKEAQLNEVAQALSISVSECVDMNESLI